MSERKKCRPGGGRGSPREKNPNRLGGKKGSKLRFDGGGGEDNWLPQLPYPKQETREVGGWEKRGNIRDLFAR